MDESPRADYVHASEGAALPSNEPFPAQSSLPILASGGRTSSDDFRDGPPASAKPYEEPEVAAFDPAANTPPTTTRESSAARASPIRNVFRSWMVLRWKLSRNVFSVPLPFLTANADVKLGDFILTLPAIAALIAVTALQAANRQVKESGTPASIAMLLVFALAVRNNSVLLGLTGIPFERALFYHKLLGLVTVVVTGLHGLAYLLNNMDFGLVLDEDMMLTGAISFGAMVLLTILSLNVIRRRFFEFFVRVHWILFLVAAVFAVVHGAGLVLVGIAPWAIDMLFRLVYRTRVYSHGSPIGKKGNEAKSNGSSKSSRMGVIASSQVTASLLPGNIVRIQFPRVREDTGEEFTYVAGQYAFLCVPTISSLEWHPFTISSAPHETMVTFHIKALGDWTKKLVTATSSSENSLALDIFVDGPYGSVSVDIENLAVYSHFVLFSGGIGVTPMRSIVNQLHHERYKENRLGIQQVHFVWSVRDRAIVQGLLDSQVPEEAYFPQELVSLTSNNGPADGFYSEFYLTRGERDFEAQVDQQLGSFLRYGSRPDTTAILRAMGEKAKQGGKDRVAVLVCGPGAMVKDVVTTSLTLSSEMKLHFDVHTEHFEF